jgi:transposase-like protein
MSKVMPKSTAEAKFRYIKPILDKQLTIRQVSLACQFSIRALKYWLSNFRQSGLSGLENKSTAPKSNPHELPIRIKERILELRRQNKKCAPKLLCDLQKENIFIGTRVIGKVLKKEGITRKYRIRKVQYKYIRVPLQQGELVEIDIKYIPSHVKGKRYYQFTAIDCASRWRHLSVYGDASSFSAVSFLKEIIKVAPFKISAVKTDNGPCFTNRYTGYSKSKDPLNPKLHAFDEYCGVLEMEHYLIDPGKPAQNGKVERSHRADQETFYDYVKFDTLEELKYKLRLWNMYYNDLQHCGLNYFSPNQVLGLRVQNVRA